MALTCSLRSFLLTPSKQHQLIQPEPFISRAPKQQSTNSAPGHNLSSLMLNG
jgi:hypothetical protein